MKTKISLLTITFGILAVVSSCHGNDPKVSPVAPAGLTLTTLISQDSSGLVTFKASASNAHYYTYYFGDDANTQLNSTDGAATFNYLTGSYTVRVVATSPDLLTAETTSSVTVFNNPDRGYKTPDHYDGLKLVWQDEFSGDKLNEADWNFETGGSGWGNHELEFYQRDNTTVNGGYLTITAKREDVGGMHYTSSRITTQNKQSFLYGRADIRARLPKGQGIWPALWMLGSSISTTNWPACGEIDIMEMIGGTANEGTVHGTAHWDNGGHQSDGGQKSLIAPALLADEFHVYSLLWNQTSITWYIDDEPYHTTAISGADMNELQKEFFFLFNVAVGGDWPGSPDYTLKFPQQMQVDYIRMFQ